MIYEGKIIQYNSVVKLKKLNVSECLVLNKKENKYLEELEEKKKRGKSLTKILRSQKTENVLYRKGKTRPSTNTPRKSGTQSRMKVEIPRVSSKSRQNRCQKYVGIHRRAKKHNVGGSGLE